MGGLVLLAQFLYVLLLVKMEVHAQHQIHAAVVLAGLEQLALTLCVLLLAKMAAHALHQTFVPVPLVGVEPLALILHLPPQVTLPQLQLLLLLAQHHQLPLLQEAQLQ